MINITYKNKDQDAKRLVFNENNLIDIGYDIETLLDQWAEILQVFRTNK